MSWRWTSGLVALALLLGACGSASHHVGSSHPAHPLQVKIVRPARPLWCPTIRSTLRQSKPNSPAVKSFDTRRLLGQTQHQAALVARRFHCSWRVIARDGRHFAITADLNLKRVDVTINHGRVTSVGVY